MQEVKSYLPHPSPLLNAILLIYNVRPVQAECLYCRFAMGIEFKEGSMLINAKSSIPAKKGLLIISLNFIRKLPCVLPFNNYDVQSSANPLGLLICDSLVLKSCFRLLLPLPDFKIKKSVILYSDFKKASLRLHDFH